MAQKAKNRTKEAAKEKVEETRASLDKATQKGREIATKQIHKSRRAIQSKPLTAVGAGVAAGAAAGVIAGVLLTRGKKGDKKKGGAEEEGAEVTVEAKGSDDDLADDDLEGMEDED